MVPSMVGSSPLARGLPVPTGDTTDRSGIIPARAGFTSTTTGPTPADSDHPRSRGVYPQRAFVGRIGSGSSPLARGLLCPASHKLTLARIIPARAGFTSLSFAFSAEFSDHPRSRGVYFDGLLRIRRLRGSSPLARGLPFTIFDCGLGHRIIPARAGFTAAFRPRPVFPWDHPRSRGVYISPHRCSVLFQGSSPLARGLHSGHDQHDRIRGIIPARAGFTSLGLVGMMLIGDHPRSRGVYTATGALRASRAGSSPLARGLPERRESTDAHPGIIPARAGFTPPLTPTRPRSTDHPRSRGVYPGVIGPLGLGAGSSPLARGLPRHAMLRHAYHGIIPARAGFTSSAGA